MNNKKSEKKFSDNPGFYGINLAALRAPLLAILGAMALGTILILLTGKNPIDAFAALIEGAVGGANQANLIETLRRAGPIVGMGIAASIPARGGFLNIGGEGQLVLGGLTAALVAAYVPFPAPIVIILAIIAAATIAGLFALIPAIFEFRFNFPILMSSMLLNYPARFLTTYITKTYFGVFGAGYVTTKLISPEMRLPKLISGTQLHSGVLVILGIVIIAELIMNRTVLGYEIKMSGFNPLFVEYGGVNRKRLGYRVMFISGCIAGIVGAVEVLAIQFRYNDGSLTVPMYAWIGLMAALLSGFNPLGVLFAGSFFAALKIGGYGMERAVGVPRELSDIFQAIIIMFVSIRTFFGLGKKKPKA